MDALLADLHRKGFGGLERATVVGKLQDLSAGAEPPASFWDEVRRSAPAVAPKVVRQSLAWRPRRGVVLGAAAFAVAALPC